MIFLLFVNMKEPPMTHDASETFLVAPKRENTMSQYFRIVRTGLELQINLGAMPALPVYLNPLRDDHYIQAYREPTTVWIDDWHRLRLVEGKLMLDNGVLEFISPAAAGEAGIAFWSRTKMRAAHPTILDALILQPELAPRSLFVGPTGESRLLIFGGIAFLNQDNGLGLRGLYMDAEGTLRQQNVSLHNHLLPQHVMVVLP